MSNRFIRVDFQEYQTVLNRFVEFIDNTTIIHDFVLDCGEPTFIVENEVKDVACSYGRSRFDFGNTDQEEVTNIYSLLKYLVNNKWGMGIWQPYSHSRSYQDWAKGFNEQVVMVLVNHISGYLTKIGIDMGMDENTRYSITVNNGQVNLAADNATINATQNNGIDASEVSKLITELRESVSTLDSDVDKEAAQEYIEVIESELRNSKPKKSLLRTAITGLQAINGTVQFGAAIATIIQFIQTINF